MDLQLFGKVKVLARHWQIFVETATAGTWQKVGGIESFTLSSDSETADNTDFDSEGYDESFISGRSNEISLEAKYIVDVATGDRDLGQVEVETLATKIGHESIGKLRLVSPAKEVTEYAVHATLGDTGGAKKDTTSWGATMGVSGKPKVIATDATAIYKDKDGTTITIA